MRNRRHTSRFDMAIFAVVQRAAHMAVACANALLSQWNHAGSEECDAHCVHFKGDCRQRCMHLA